MLRIFYSKKHIVYLDDYYRSSHEHHNLKCEICGHIWQSSFINSRKHGCPECGRNLQNNQLRWTIDEIKAEAKKKDIEFLDDYYAGNHRQKHNFKCCKCGTVFINTVANVLYSKNGHNCPFTIERAQTVCQHKDIKFLDNSFHIIDDYYSFQCNVCGYVWKTQFSHILYSNTAGCPKCHKARKACENIVKKRLIEIFGENNVISQYKIKTYNQHIQRYVAQFIDFFIPEKQLGIEYNGRQHYESIIINGFRTDFAAQQDRDRRKRQYCHEHNIKLIEIDGRLFEKHPENLTVEYIIQLLGEAGIIY